MKVLQTLAGTTPPERGALVEPRVPRAVGSTTSRSRSGQSTRRSRSTAASSSSSCAVGSGGWRSSTWATSSSRSPRAERRGRKQHRHFGLVVDDREAVLRRGTRCRGRGLRRQLASSTRGQQRAGGRLRATCSSRRRPRSSAGWASGSRSRTRRSGARATRACPDRAARARHRCLLVLLVAGAALLVLVPRVRIPYPILLVLGGLALGFVPGMPELELPPELVLVGVPAAAPLRRRRSSPRSATCARTSDRSGCSRSGSCC